MSPNEIKELENKLTDALESCFDPKLTPKSQLQSVEEHIRAALRMVKGMTCNCHRPAA